MIISICYYLIGELYMPHQGCAADLALGHPPPARAANLHGGV